jgi:hypothetical protein
MKKVTSFAIDEIRGTLYVGTETGKVLYFSTLLSYPDGTVSKYFFGPTI